MEHKLKHYTITLTTQGPLFIGSGRKIGKKEYILSKGKAYIPDMGKMLAFFERHRLTERYEDFLLGRGGSYGGSRDYNNMSRDSAKKSGRQRKISSRGSDDDFAAWLSANKIGEKEYKFWTDYVLDCGYIEFDKKNKNREILTFQKDAYGKPYVPGSSLKGALRTALLAGEIRKAPEKFELQRNNVRSFREWKNRRKSKKIADGIEKFGFRLLKCNEKNAGDAVNDILRGLRVGDSEPLSADALTLCQKIDVSVTGMENRLPILRECIKPGTEIRFQLTLDPEYCPYTCNEISDVAMDFIDSYDKIFRDKFLETARSKIKFPYDARDVYLGGGAGFVSKTVLYALLNGGQGLQKASEILMAQFSRHKHEWDTEKGVSPHMLKCTRYKGQLYEMGVCTMDIG